MAKEAEEAGEGAIDTLKQRVFASAFGSFDPRTALDQYHRAFEQEPEPEELDIEQFEPESEADVESMVNMARRAGVIS